MGEENNKKKPVREVRIGSIKIAFWENEHDGKTYTNATVGRIYKDGKDNWQTSDSFGRDDLLVLSQVALQAYLELSPLQVKAVQ